MSLYKKWDEITKREMTPAQSKMFWESYLLKEKAVYEQILESKEFKIESTLKDFSDKFSLEPKFVVGFIDGINTSLEKEIELENLTEESAISLDIDKEKLFYNMHVAEAEWLYNLPQWDENLSLEKRKEIEKNYKSDKTFRADATIGRNDPCVCGSSKKYKKCCGK